MSKTKWGGGFVTFLSLLLAVAILPDWLRGYLAAIFALSMLICGIGFFFARDKVANLSETASQKIRHSEVSGSNIASAGRDIHQNIYHQTPFDESSAIALTSDTFEIEAIASPNLQNLTERGFDMQGKPPFCLECIVSVRNLHPTQGIDEVFLRLLDIDPSMVASPIYLPRTQDTTLRRVRFHFDDIPANAVLKGSQTAHIKIFEATRPIAAKGLEDIHLRFYGTWPDNSKTEFVPQLEHVITVEVTGSGVKGQEAQFILSFSPESDNPVFSVRKVAGLQREKKINEARADRIANTIGRRLTEIEKGITNNLGNVRLLESLNIEPEVSKQIQNKPKPIEGVEPQLIEEAYSIDRDLSWPEFREMGIAIKQLNEGINRNNDLLRSALSHDLLRQIEEIRSLIVVIQRE
jgi:hypothetical protein